MLSLRTALALLFCLTLSGATYRWQKAEFGAPPGNMSHGVTSSGASPQTSTESKLSTPIKSSWYRDHDWLSAISTAVQALTSLLALLGAAIAVVYARRSWLASEHTLAASVRPVIGVELSTLNPSTGEVRFRLKNLGNGVALGIFYWMDFSEGASSYWTWSKWPFNRENGDLAEQIIETLEVDGSFDYNTRYPIENIIYLTQGKHCAILSSVDAYWALHQQHLSHS